MYIPPFKLARMLAEVKDTSSPEYQRMTWDALRKSLNGLINKVRRAARARARSIRLASSFASGSLHVQTTAGMCCSYISLVSCMRTSCFDAVPTAPSRRPLVPAGERE